ncbi:MAG: eCIS core domain-containing protein, partial [Chitinophagales bacterium]
MEGKRFWHKSNAVIQGKGGIGYPAVPIFGKKQPIQQKADTNNTGLPDNLKSGIENLSGYSMDDVKVHYNSDKPAQLQAHAFAQGTDIHLGAGQEKHLAHEAWHVVQQKQGRVKPTVQMKGKVNVNDDSGLEREADVMGAKALQMKGNHNEPLKTSSLNGEVSQMKGETVQLQEAGGYTAGVEAISDKEKALAYSQKMGLTEHPPNPFYIKVPAKATYKGRLPKEYVWNAIIHNVHAHNNIKSYSQFEIPIVGDSGFDDYHTIGWIEKGMLQMISVPLKSKEWKTKEQSYVKAKPKKETEKSLIEFAVGKKDGKYVGNTMDDIRKVQKLLVQVNCLAENEVDGKIGPKTAKAIEKFQSQKGYTLTKTGYISPKDNSLEFLQAKAKIASKKDEIKPIRLDDGPNALIQGIKRLTGWDNVNTGSGNINLTLKLGLSAAALGRLVKAGGDIEFGITLGYDIGDDRRFKVGWSIGLDAKFQTSAILGLLNSEFNVGASYTDSGIFDNIEHFVAYFFKIFYRWKKKLGDDEVSSFFKTKDPSLARRLAHYQHKDFIREQELEGHGSIGANTGETKFLGFDAEAGVRGGGGISGKRFTKEENGYIYTKDGSVKKGFIEANASLGDYSLEFIAEYNGITKDANPDNDGDYWKYELTLEGAWEYSVKDSNYINRAIKGVTNMNAKAFTLVLNRIAGYLNSSVGVPKKKSNKLMKQSVLFTWNNVLQNGKYRLQYFRISRKGEYGFEAEQEIPIFTNGVTTANAKVGMSASASRTYGIYEKIGTNTITYATTAYNGYKKGLKDYTWSDFRKAHSEALVRIAFNIGNPKSNVAAEFDHTIKGTDIFYKE